MRKLVIEHDKAQRLLDYLVTRPYAEVFGFVELITKLPEVKEAETGGPVELKEVKAHGVK